MTAYLAATPAQSTPPLFYDIALHAGLCELFAQLGISASSSGTERLPGATFGDVPCLAATTQLAKVPFGIIRRTAASSSVRPCVTTSFTASSRSSGVYVFERVISSPFGEIYQTRVSEKIRLPQADQALVKAAAIKTRADDLRHELDRAHDTVTELRKEAVDERRSHELTLNALHNDFVLQLDKADLNEKSAQDAVSQLREANRALRGKLDAASVMPSERAKKLPINHGSK